MNYSIFGLATTSNITECLFSLMDKVYTESDLPSLDGLKHNIGPSSVNCEINHIVVHGYDQKQLTGNPILYDQEVQ